MKGTTPHLARARAANQMYLVNLLIDVLDKDLVLYIYLSLYSNEFSRKIQYWTVPTLNS